MNWTIYNTIWNTLYFWLYILEYNFLFRIVHSEIQFLYLEYKIVFCIANFGLENLSSFLTFNGFGMIVKHWLLNVDQFWRKICNEVDKISNMKELDLMKFVGNEDELVRRDCVKDFTLNEVNRISFIFVKGLRAHVIMLTCICVSISYTR